MANPRHGTFQKYSLIENGKPSNSMDQKLNGMVFTENCFIKTFLLQSD